jgi:hypothetical protein
MTNEKARNKKPASSLRLALHVPFWCGLGRTLNRKQPTTDQHAARCRDITERHLLRCADGPALSWGEKMPATVVQVQGGPAAYREVGARRCKEDAPTALTVYKPMWHQGHQLPGRAGASSTYPGRLSRGYAFYLWVVEFTGIPRFDGV